MDNLERYLEKLDEETKKEVSKHFFALLNQYRPVKGGLERLMRQFEEWLINFTKQRAKEKKYMPGVDYNKEGKPYPENVNGNLYIPAIALFTSARGKEFIRIEEEGPGNRYRWKKVYNTWDNDDIDPDYTQKGDWTVGVGHRVLPNEWSRFLKADGRISVSLSSQEIDTLFEEDIKIMEAGVKGGLTGALLTQYEFDALVSLLFQKGQNIIRNRPTTFVVYINNRNTNKIIETFENFGTPSRRKREIELYKTGRY